MRRLRVSVFVSCSCEDKGPISKMLRIRGGANIRKAQHFRHSMIREHDSVPYRVQSCHGSTVRHGHGAGSVTLTFDCVFHCHHFLFFFVTVMISRRNTPAYDQGRCLYSLLVFPVTSISESRNMKYYNGLLIGSIVCFYCELRSKNTIRQFVKIC